MQELPFTTLLYRYFFFSWLFKDATDGNMFERAAIVRHNREQARWLPTYLLRWMWWGLGFYALGSFADVLLEAPTLAFLLYAFSSASIPFFVAVASTWVGLRAQPGGL